MRPNFSLSPFMGLNAQGQGPGPSLSLSLALGVDLSVTTKVGTKVHDIVKAKGTSRVI